jgi:hypothetical protein
MERRLNKMTNEQFTYWLKGVLDTAGQHITSANIDMIKAKLNETMSDDNQPIQRPIISPPFKKTMFQEAQSTPIMKYGRGSDHDIDKRLSGYETELLNIGRNNTGLIIEDPK